MILGSLPEGKELTLNNKKIPGIVRNVSVSGKMQADRNARGDSGGGRDFSLKGWEPAEVSVELALLSGESKSQGLEAGLEALIALFKKTKDGEALQYELSFPQTNAWGIGRCYLTDMSSSKDSKQMYSVSLKFVEFRPEIDKIKRQAEKKTTSIDATAGPAPQAAKDEKLEQHTQRLLAQRQAAQMRR